MLTVLLEIVLVLTRDSEIMRCKITPNFCRNLHEIFIKLQKTWT